MSDQIIRLSATRLAILIKDVQVVSDKTSNSDDMTRSMNRIMRELRDLLKNNVEVSNQTNPVMEAEDGSGFYFYDETWSHLYGPWKSRPEANWQLALYTAIQLEGIPDAILAGQLVHKRQVMIPPLESSIEEEIRLICKNNKVIFPVDMIKEIASTIGAHIGIRHQLLDKERIVRLFREYDDFMSWKGWPVIGQDYQDFLCDLILDNKDKIKETMKSWHENHH